jgi:hypothetical protein
MLFAFQDGDWYLSSSPLPVVTRACNHAQPVEEVGRNCNRTALAHCIRGRHCEFAILHWPDEVGSTGTDIARNSGACDEKGHDPVFDSAQFYQDPRCNGGRPTVRSAFDKTIRAVIIYVAPANSQSETLGFGRATSVDTCTILVCSR